MSDQQLIIDLSTLDEKHFGYITAKASSIHYNNLEQLFSFCSDKDVEFLIARCDPVEIKAVHAMEREGFLLMDTSVYYTLDLLSALNPRAFLDHTTISKILPGEEREVEEIARQAFASHIGHYHADEKLDANLCTEVYASWAYNCCISKEFADRVFVASVHGRPAGFSALKRLSKEEWKGVLMGVLPQFRTCGLGKALTAERIIYCISQGGQFLTIPVSAANYPIQIVLHQLNFKALRFEYIFHKWFI
jgi:hypothetical protein